MRQDVKKMGAEAIGSLTAWCGECNAETEFDKVPGGVGVEYACRDCAAAVFTGELSVIESLLQPAV